MLVTCYVAKKVIGIRRKIKRENTSNKCRSRMSFLFGHIRFAHAILQIVC